MLLKKKFACCVLAMAAVLCAALPAKTDDAKPRYPNMAPIERYLISDRGAEIALARSAAPEAISRNATVLVLGRHGYETAARGTNGFVCLVERPWTYSIDFPELWNPKILGPDCLNPPAARSLLPIVYKKTQLVLAGYSEAKIIAALSAAFQEKELPALEPGAMGFMMSKSAYLTDDDHHNLSHLMFFTTLSSGAVWGADLPKSPVASFSFWFPNDNDNPLAHGLPPIRIFIVGVKRWSDGTPQPVK
jgi:hypothetical protein